MKHSRTKRVVALLLSFVMTVGVISSTAFASIAGWSENNVTYSGNTFGTNGYYNVISNKSYDLIPGAATETELVVNNSTGTRRQVMHIMEIDPSNPDVSLVPGYYNIDKDLDDSNNWTSSKLTEMAAYYEENLGYNIVGGMNTSLDYDSYAPIDILVYNGVDYSKGVHSAATFLAVVKDPETGAISCELHNKGDGIPKNCWQAVSCNFGFTVKDGELVSKTVERTSDPASRSMIGIKEDGTLVLCMNDGRGANNSVGFCNYELGESMLALGCKWAVNCDGGGSSTFISQRVGEEDLTLRNVPSDGSQRPTIHGVFVVNNNASDGIFANASITTENSYVTPNSTVEFTATGADKSGAPVDIPAEAVWELEDSSYGTISNGTFVSNGKTGEVVVNMKYEGEVVGSAKVNVVNPERIEFSDTNLVVPYGKAYTYEINAYVNGSMPVAIKAADFDFTSTGFTPSMDGFTMAAVAENSGITGGTFTATYKHAAGISATANVSFGIGSKVVYDFEGDATVTTTRNKEGVPFDSTVDFGSANGPIRFIEGSCLTGSYPYGYGIFGEADVVTEENGKVRNGDQALELKIDLTAANSDGHRRIVLTNLMIDATDATAIGMWIYVPTDAPSLTVYVSNFEDNISNPFKSVLSLIGDNQIGQSTSKYKEDGWYYVSASLAGAPTALFKEIDGRKYLNTIVFKVSDGFNKSADFWNVYGKYTTYIDDITLDYSSAVEDKVNPTIGDFQYAVQDSGVALADKTVTDNTLSIYANATDNTGIVPSTAKCYIDGIAYDGVTCSNNGKISIDSKYFSDGYHTVRFEIEDKMGNLGFKTCSFTVNSAEGDVYFTQHDPDAKDIKIGSIQYFDIVAKNIDKVQKVTTTIDLDGQSEWQLDHVEVPYGFTYTYSIEDNYNKANITIERTGNCKLEGEQILASIPVRTGEYHAYLWDISDYSSQVTKSETRCDALKTIATPYTLWNASECVFKVAIIAKAEMGQVTYTNGSTDTFTSDDYTIATEKNFFRNAGSGSASTTYPLTVAEIQAEIASKNSWHIHEEGTAQSKAPTCTENGYEGRTFCVGCECDQFSRSTEGRCDCQDGCGSVVNWGTTIPATGHTYELVDGKFVCATCGDELELGTGLVEVNDKTYYAMGGVLQTGWQEADGEYYYFMPDTFEAAEGDVKTTDGVTFNFENGKVTKGVWVTDSRGTRYWYGPTYYKFSSVLVSYIEQEIEGKTYVISQGGYIQKDKIVATRKTHDITLFWYSCDEDGIATVLTGPKVQEYNSKLYYIDEEGKSPAAGLVKINDDYYYVIYSGSVKRSGSVYISTTETNGLLPASTYDFGADGKMTTPLNGVDAYGYYREDGVVKKNAGLVKYKEEYYLIGGNGKVSTGSFYVTKTNGLLPSSTYVFGEDGKMTTPLTGVDSYGYYRKDGVVGKSAGLVKVGDDYYFINSAGKANVGSYYVTKTNGLVPPSTYVFGEDGKMTTPLTGVDSYGYYRKDGVVGKSAGLVKDGDNYYYINSIGKARTGSYYVSDTNKLLPASTYVFGEDGKMTTPLNGIDSYGYYRADGVVQKGIGLTLIDGDYYFIRQNGKIATGKYYLSTTEAAGIVSAGYHDFGTDGKLVQ